MRLYRYDDPFIQPDQDQLSRYSRFHHPRFQGCVGRWLGNTISGRVVANYALPQASVMDLQTWVGAAAGDIPVVGETPGNLAPKLVTASTHNLDSTASTGFDASLTNRLTFIARLIYHTALGGVTSRIFFLHDSAPDFEHFIQWEDGGSKGPRAQINANGTPSTTAFGANIVPTIGKIENLAWTYDQVTQSVYRDGIVYGTSTTSATLRSTSRTTVGKIFITAAPTYASAFTLLDIALYNRGMNASEINSFIDAPYLEFYPIRKWWFIAPSTGLAWIRA